MRITASKKRPNGWKALQTTCAGCSLFRAMIFKDTGADAFCGRCMKDPEKMGRVRSSCRMACGEYKPRKEV